MAWTESHLGSGGSGSISFGTPYVPTGYTFKNVDDTYTAVNTGFILLTVNPGGREYYFYVKVNDDNDVQYKLSNYSWYQTSILIAVNAGDILKVAASSNVASGSVYIVEIPFG